MVVFGSIKLGEVETFAATERSGGWPLKSSKHLSAFGLTLAGCCSS
jgi:hypothetical protein